MSTLSPFFTIVRQLVTPYTAVAQVKMVLYRNRFYVESADEKLLQQLQRDPVIRKAKATDSTDLMRSAALKEHVCTEANQTHTTAP